MEAIAVLTSVNEYVPVKARAFVTVSHFHPSLIFFGQTGVNQSEGPYRNPEYLICYLGLAANIRLGWKLMTFTNALAYNGSQLITVVKVLQQMALINQPDTLDVTKKI